jgi:xanthine/uracil permease
MTATSTLDPVALPRSRRAVLRLVAIVLAIVVGAAIAFAAGRATTSDDRASSPASPTTVVSAVPAGATPDECPQPHLHVC